MESFWAGFCKNFSKTAGSVIDTWKDESTEAVKKSKKSSTDTKFDPVSSSQSVMPDIYWKSWP